MFHNEEDNLFLGVDQEGCVYEWKDSRIYPPYDNIPQFIERCGNWLFNMCLFAWNKDAPNSDNMKQTRELPDFREIIAPTLISLMKLFDTKVKEIEDYGVEKTVEEVQKIKSYCLDLWIGFLQDLHDFEEEEDS